MPKLASPGLPISRKITTGRVGCSSRARNEVAPNSPRLTANAKPAATTSGRATTGTSTVRNARSGPAPSDAAAWRWRSSTPLSTGTRVRTTSGSATRAWAIGTSSGDEVSRVSRKPKPSVTADTPSGSMKNASRVPRSRRSALPSERRLTTTAISPPSSSDIQVASTAVRRLVTSASVAGTSSALPSPTVVSLR